MVTGAPAGSLPAAARGGEVVVALAGGAVFIEVAPAFPPEQPLTARTTPTRAAAVRRQA
ncbi:hypothetical protein ACQPZQ_32740 [Pseudonocardia sp. CA-142604]|uniref:hypothetical protein n=1 Tax=Pseudonocardia sp. CA-142604 TaxID=3240024 RepID=UPI003D8B75AA